MICLTCGHDSAGLGPRCEQCEAWIGIVADSRGFLPQLEHLRNGLQQGQVSRQDATTRLERLRHVLEAMVAHMDETGAGLAGLELEEVQQGVLSGFMMPIREGLTDMLEAVSSLDPAGGWPEEVWSRIEQAQVQVIRGNEGVSFLIRTAADFVQQAAAQTSSGESG